MTELQTTRIRIEIVHIPVVDFFDSILRILDPGKISVMKVVSQPTVFSSLLQKSLENLTNPGSLTNSLASPLGTDLMYT